MPVLDEMGRNYLAMGIIENTDDVKTCPRCQASVMPWHMGCEGCGNTDMSEPKERWCCSNCTEEYESEDDADRCCAPMCFCCEQYYDTPEEAERCCGLDADMLHVRQEDGGKTVCGLALDEYNWESFDEWKERDQREDFDPNPYCHGCIGENHSS